ncbi:carbamoyl-phosphate synthase [Halalkalibacter wakoensis JCM 9140]|uniref:biotin carboxylase n=1 Tax=Halalkalibacter wakoensis JCM 9140 TaxID=1236970 RepID=W4Q1L3_9BACI|nr:carbamoyl-phosphate synthase [Halalkalibacter wakoensis JCM 9140]
MQVVNSEEELRKAFQSNQKRASMFFGNGEMYAEKAIEKARHIEFQLLADQHGNVLHLYERDCSVQRRHQKVIEESPSPFLDEQVIEEIGALATNALKKIGYVNAGTIECLVDDKKNVYFLEMNTRLQVEHPVTEEITGLDLVEWQIRIAAGEALPFTQNEVTRHGHAIEARIYAEDPKRFFPSPGTITELFLPMAPNIRHECGVEIGSVVTPYYDPMIAKVIVKGETRMDAIQKLKIALEQYKVTGIKTNIPMVLDVLSHRVFEQGQANTAFVRDYIQKR